MLSKSRPRWPRREARFWETAPFFRLLLPLAGGIVVYDRVGPVPAQTPGLWIGGLLALGTLATLVLVRRFTRGGAAAAVQAAAFMATFFFLGFLAASVKDVRNDPAWIGHHREPGGATVLRIEAEPKCGPRTWAVRGQVLGIATGPALRRATGTVLLHLYRNGAPPGAVGDTLVVASGWQHVENTRNPFGFDYKTFCRRQNIFHQQFLAPDAVFAAGRAQLRDHSVPDRLHRAARAALRRYVTDTATLGILEAMLVGYEGDFSPELRQAYSETGVVHIVAISGSHVATLFLMFWWIPRVVRGRWGRWLQYGLGLVAVWLYVLVAGAPPSAVRSAVVFTFLAAGVVFGRDGQALNTVLASAFFILCVEPMWLFSVGFQLSVAAVLSLVLFYPAIRAWWTPAFKPLQLLWDAGAASIAAQLLVAPLCVYYFHNFPLWFFAANLAAWLLLGFLGLVGGLLLLAFSGWPLVAKGIAALLTILVTGFNAIVSVFQAWNPVSFRFLHLSTAELLLVYGVIGGLGAFLLLWRKSGLWLASGCLLALLLLLGRDAWTARHNERLLVYAVSRHTVAEHLRGRHYQTLFTDTVSENLRTPRESRTGYGAWRPDATPTLPLQTIAGKSILTLTGSETRFASGAHFPVDVLLIARPLKGLSAAALQKTFSPGVLVVGGAEKQWRTEAWADSCRRIGQRFHATRLHGAFVLE